MSDLKPSHAVANAFRFNVSPEYFRAARTVLLAGRPFAWHDDKDAPRVAAVNQTLAVKLFGGVTKAWADISNCETARGQVVGVVENGRYMNLTEDPESALFLPVL